MTKELVVSASPHETKVAIVEDGQVAEIYVEREKEYGLVGSIYKGRVTRVLPGMQSAFVEIGLDRDSFLYVSDFIEDTEEYEAIVATVEEKVARMEEQAAPAAVPTVVPVAFPARTPEIVVAAAEPVPAVAPVAEVVAPAEPPVEAPPVETVVTPPAHPQAFSEERRGPYGRGRRRRRGKGFPESKYVRPSYGPPEPHEPLILPGESLAKYKNRILQPESAEPRPSEPATPATRDVTAEPPAESHSAAENGGPGVPEQHAAEAPPESHPSSAENEAAPSAQAPAESRNDASERQADGETAQDTRTREATAPAGSAPVAEPSTPGAAITEPGAPERSEVSHRWPHPTGRLRRPRRRQRRRGGGHGPRKEARPQPMIADLLREGQEIIVQIVKEPLGKKGARITSHIALPGRYVVYMPTVDHIGVSRKISSEDERARLRRMLLELKGAITGGFIVRTAAEGHSEDDLRADIQFLANVWTDIRAKAEQKSAPALLHRDLNLIERILRDQISSDYSAIWIDNSEEYAKVLDFVSRFQTSLVNRVKLYTKKAPIFEEFSIQPEIEKALRPKVWLKSGGYIVINHTEALVAIDVNTGKYVGKSARLEDTIVRTNLDAVKEIVRQIRLRDLGGIIIVDFIDMEERKNRIRVMQALEEALRADRAPSKVLAFNEFGLVAITRKRVKQSLEKILCQPCLYCTGTGMVKSVPTICYEIQDQARKMAGEIDAPEMTLRVHPEIAKALKTRESALVAELEEQTHKNLIVQPDPTLHFEQFDIY